MKLYWLKRLALKWLVNDQSFYFIMAALRGPDIIEHENGMSERIKQQSTARIRGAVGLDLMGPNSGYAVVESGPPKTIEEMEGVKLKGKDELGWYHFDGHILTAVTALKKVGY